MPGRIPRFARPVKHGPTGYAPLTRRPGPAATLPAAVQAAGIEPHMEIYRGGSPPQTVHAASAPAAHPFAGLRLPNLSLADLDPLLLVLGLGLAFAAWRAQRSWLRGFLGEWRVARLLRRQGLDARHDVLLPHPDGAGWTQIDHLVRLPDRILVIETKNLGGRLTGGGRDARWTQRCGRRSFSILNPLHQNALHLRAVRAVVGRDVRVQGLVLLVGRAWIDERLPPGCCRLPGFGRLLREAPCATTSG